MGKHMMSVTVRNTFVDVAFEDRGSPLIDSAKRASSDPCLLTEKTCSSRDGNMNADQLITLQGLSDTDTDREDYNYNPLPCYQHIADGFVHPASVTGSASFASSTSESAQANEGELTPEPADGFTVPSSAASASEMEDQPLRDEVERLTQLNAELEQKNRLLQELYFQATNAPAASFSGWAPPMNVAAVQPVGASFGGHEGNGGMMQQVLYFAVPEGQQQRFQQGFVPEKFPKSTSGSDSKGKKAGRSRGSAGVQPGGESHSTHTEMLQLSHGEACVTTDACSVDGTESSDVRTTVMLRNLPNNYTRAMILSMLDSEGFAGQYDFVYLPMDFNTLACLGYAFVNLDCSSTAQRFWNKFDGYSNWVIPSRKLCFVSWSNPHQGLKSNIDRYRNSPVMHEAVPDDYKPIYLVNGVPAPFPAPTKKIRVPRIKNYAATRNSFVPFTTPSDSA